jgi:cytochrome c oxidase cbb3-type subunit III
MAKETNQVLGHGADADGIEEYDNPLPDWWLGLFLLTVIFGIGYGVNYHFIAGDSQAKRYEAEMARAQR